MCTTTSTPECDMLMRLLVGSIALHPVMTPWVKCTQGTAVKYIWAPLLWSLACDIRRGYVDSFDDMLARWSPHNARDDHFPIR